MSTLDWLRAGDPAIAWQALRDLSDTDATVVAAERARVSREGVAATILARQAADGAWHLPDEPDWFPTLHHASLLHATGADPADPAVAAAYARLAEGFRWHEEFGAKPFFEGEVEPCINGRVLAIGAYCGRADDALARRLLGDQLADGGWNCDAPKSAVASFHSTICVLEGLLAYERATGASPELAAARRRGEEYLLARGLFRRRSTGAIADPAFVQLAFPTRYGHDILRALDYFREAGAPADPRVADAARLLAGKRAADGTWPLEATHPDGLGFPLDEAVGAPSRWNTLRALRVLRWCGTLSA